MGANISSPEPMASLPKPSEMMPRATISRHSSVSSESSGASASSAQQATQLLPQPQTPLSRETLLHPQLLAAQLDPLSRDYPKPVHEIDVREALARKPIKWTLGHYISEQSAAEPRPKTTDRETISRDLEAKKRELLQAKEDILKLTLPK
ncbi:hypothetical protein BD289DRAFT_478284 [Coniella lustricola]|uniref:Uncharacterized protein n=1 Tax=Coniella lustricola TaxID=2025994 RepID=A0A2T3AN65_9PEZI|nr:hypothetical protein BD289DRAFT_478284 [Coniella lustricola]